ncbi:MAG: hypothetical protein ACYTGL_03080 [Planctomycetota bacterium]
MIPSRHCCLGLMFLAVISAASPVPGDDAKSADTSVNQSETASEDEAEAFALRYRFKPGQFVHYQVESTSKMTLQAKQEVQTIEEKRSTRKHYRVVSVDDQGYAVLEPVIDHVLMEAQTDGASPVRFDSDSSEPVPSQFTKVRETVGRVLVRVRYTPRGEVDEVTRVASDRDVNADDAESHKFLIAFPERELACGDAWDDDFTVQVSISGDFKKPLYKPVTIRRRYTLKSVDDGVATIIFSTYPLSVDRDPQIRMQLVQRSLTGTVEFDVDRGVIRKWTSAGTGQVFNPFGPSSSAQASSSNVERLVTSARRPRKRGPIGPQPIGPAAAPGAGD